MGEQVLLSTEHSHLKNTPVRKLKKRFVGYSFVTRRIGPVAYELELPQTWRIHPIFDTSLLHPFRMSTWSTPQESAVDELELEGDRSYEVQKLLRWCWSDPSTKHAREYLVLLSGYSIDDASWIPATNFDYPEVLEEMVTRDQLVEDPR